MSTGPFSLMGFVAVGIGALLGAWSRWGLSVWLNSGPDRFPLGTFSANLAGSYVIGLIIAWTVVSPELPANLRLFLVTGLLGALTTFSTFSAETITFLHEGRLGLGVAYALSSLLGCLAMTSLGWLTIQTLKG
jgi:CrcB protein